MPADKMLPRNRSARAAGIRAAGNPVVVEPESGVGNCFPGLEADLRNLERRFFPYLVVDLVGSVIVPAEVDLDRARAELPAGELLGALESLTQPLVDWRIVSVQGEFAGYGQRTFTVADLGGGDLSLPPDAWTAVRLLRPGTVVTLTARRSGGRPVTLRAPRASYLDDDGAFAGMFAPGELTQSLCSPWTHDFRDCGCYYWASNHPDIVQPALPPGTPPDDPDYGGRANWLRADRLTSPPPPDVAHDQAGELRHMEINGRWQELDVVLDGREQRGDYDPQTVPGVPLAPGALVPTLRYAAGVELAVMIEYLAAAFSLDTGAADQGVRNDARAAQYELLRVATSEMHHLRAVNRLLFDEHLGAPGAFAPALGVATVIPEPAGAPGRPVAFRPLTPDVLEYFVQVEKPSRSVDALYGNILATYQAADRETAAATVAQVMAEGADHYTTFRTVAEWLNRHPGTPYLRTLRVPAEGDPVLATLQQRYEGVLGHLHDGYRLGIPAGGPSLRQAIAGMLDPDGLRAACEALVAGGDLPVFATPADPRFAPVAPP